MEAQGTIEIIQPRKTISMNTFFEITPDDWEHVLSLHGVIINDRRIDSLMTMAKDETDLLEGVDNCCNLDEQTEIVHANIEKYLAEVGLVPKDKKFF